MVSQVPLQPSSGAGCQRSPSTWGGTPPCQHSARDSPPPRRRGHDRRRTSSRGGGIMTAPPRPMRRWHWRNWPVLVKLLSVLLVPTVVALVVGGLRIVDQAGSAPSF